MRPSWYHSVVLPSLCHRAGTLIRLRDAISTVPSPSGGRAVGDWRRRSETRTATGESLVTNIIIRMNCSLNGHGLSSAHLIVLYILGGAHGRLMRDTLCELSSAGCSCRRWLNPYNERNSPQHSGRSPSTKGLNIMIKNAKIPPRSPPRLH